MTLEIFASFENKLKDTVLPGGHFNTQFILITYNALMLLPLHLN